MSENKEGRKKGLISPEQMQEFLASAYSTALNGVPGVSKSIEDLAADYSSQFPDDKKRAAEELAKNQVIKSGATGFVTGLGGLVTLPVTLPTDVVGVIVIQLRMIAAIACLGGFDPHSDQVQTLSYACLVKGGVAEVFKNAGIKVSENLAIGAIKKIPGYVIANINKKLGFSLVTRFGGSQFGKQAVVNLSKMVPVIGGVIGGGFDAFTTNAAASRAITLFIDKSIPDADAELEGTVIESDEEESMSTD